ncbi:hypothetical protein N2152v2_008205 [Parachlorella kessleri]
MDYADGSVHALTMGDSELRMILDAAAERQQLLVVDFSASWCGPCKAMVPVLADLARVHQGRVVFCKVDCEESPRNRQLAQEAAITAFPTFHVYRARQRVAEFRGANRPQLLATIQEQLALLPSRAGTPGVAAGTGSAAPVGPPGPMAIALAQALGRVRSSCSFEDFVAAARTLLTFVSNILNNPGDPKYRRIRVSNASFHSKLGAKPGGKECMAALGFQERQEEGGAVLVLEAVPEELPQIKAMLEQALPQAGAATAAAAPVVAPSAAGPPASVGAGPSARPTASAGRGSAGNSAAAAAVHAGALARALAAAMGNAGTPPQQPPQQQQERLVAGQRTPAGSSGSSGQLGPPDVGGAQARPRVLRVSPQGLARMLERVLLDGGLGQPGSNPAQ